MAKFCTNCGSKLPDGVRFCPECGTAAGVVIDAPAGSTVTVSDTPPEKAAANSKPKPAAASKKAKKQPEPSAGKMTKKTSKSSRVISVILVLVMIAELAVAGFKYPGFLRKKEDGALLPSEDSLSDIDISGVSDIRLTEEDYAVEPERVTVGAEDGCCQLESGVKVDFGRNTEVCAGKELAVRSIGGRTDERYEAEIYDFSLTDTSAFSAPVQITLPYDSSWGNNVFVQYYNEDTGSWEVLWTETDGEGNAVFSTGHFSTFAVFRDMVTGKEPVTDDGPVIVFLDDPAGMNKNVRCYINYAALAYQVKNGANEDLSVLGKPTDTYWAERGMSIINNTGGAAGYVLDAANFAEGGSIVYKGASKMLSKFGYIMAAAKILTQYNRTGDLLGTLKANKADIVSAALSAAAGMTAGGVSAVLGTVVMAVFASSLVQSVTEDINLRGAEDMTEYAYRVFTGDYATVIMNAKKGLVCSYKYAPTEYDRLARLTWNKDEVPLSDKKGLSPADWVTPLLFIAEHYSYENIPKAVENLLTQYVNIFWNVERLDKQTFEAFLNNTKDGIFGTKSLKSEYKTPSKARRQELTARFKAELYAWLMPYLNDIMEQAYYKMLDSVFADAQALEQSLNTQLTFTLADAECDNFAESEYAVYDCSLALSEDGKDIWCFSPEENWTVSCSRLMYLYAGCPSYVKVTDGTETVLTKEFTLEGDSVTITLGESEEADETLFDAPDGDGGDACWVLTDIVYVPEYSDLDKGAVDAYGNPAPWIGPHTAISIQSSSAEVRGTIEEIYETNPDLDCTMEWRMELPGTVLFAPSDFSYELWGSDSFWKDDKYSFYWSCSMYPDRKDIPLKDEGSPGYRTVSGEGIVPAPEEGGNRLIMIRFLDVGLVYRESSFSDAVDVKVNTVDSNPYDYWTDVLGQK